MREETRKRIKNTDGTTIPAKNWVVKAQWYLSTSDNPQRRSYELLDDVIHVQVSTLVQEAELEFVPVGHHVHDATNLHQEQACWILQGRSTRTSCENIIDCSKDSYFTWC